jgi:transcriptional regulator with XRE-family HTH domain
MYKERTETCAERLKRALSIRRMKQRDLCELAKVPKSSLSLYLSGAYEPKQDRIFEMSRVLNVSEAWLMGYDVPMEKQAPNTKSTPVPEITLTENEIAVVNLLRRIPEDKQKMVLQMIQVAINSEG